MSVPSVEEDHFVRLSLLLTGLSPKAVRVLFDQEFPPTTLHSVLNLKFKVLTNLKSSRVINQSQWNLLFPSSGDPDSKKFDATLMICLIRNLTAVRHPPTGYDCLPASGDVTPGADRARIKYYRNFLAHLDDNKVDTRTFNKAWMDSSDAIGRLGGPDIIQQCNDLKFRVLDQSNSEIMLEIKQSYELIKELKITLEQLKNKCRNASKKNKRQLKAIEKKIGDTLPDNIKDIIKNEIEMWKHEDNMFVTTESSKRLLERAKYYNFVTVTRSSGVGKTFTVRHVALQMEKLKYYVIPVKNPDDIIKFASVTRKTLFVVDNFCGIYTLSQGQLDMWKCSLEMIENIFLKTKNDRIIMTCRLQVYHDERVKNLPMLSKCVCNFSDRPFSLQKDEKQAIAKLYLKTKAASVSASVDLYDFFPLLCRLYYEKPKEDINDFFRHPFTVYQNEIEMLFIEKDYGKYCALALCVMFNNHIDGELLTGDINMIGEDKRLILESTCEACRLDRGTSRLVLLDALESLGDSFIKKEISSWLKYVSYSARHDKCFDILACYFGRVMIQCIIKYAVSSLISNKVLFERYSNMHHQLILIPKKDQKIYLQRMVHDWSQGDVFQVFSNINMSNPNFRDIFLKHLKSLELALQQKLVNKIDSESINVSSKCAGSSKLYISYKTNFVEENSNATALLHSCIIGDIGFVQWCVDNGADVNYCNNENKSPLYMACQNGHTVIARLLLHMKADVNKCTFTGQSPLYIACCKGETEIVNLLLKNGAQINIYTQKRQTPLYTACQNGFEEIVYYLLQRNADLNQSTVTSKSPLFAASSKGHTDVIKMLLRIKWIMLNANTKKGQTALYAACKMGNAENVKLLLEHKADIHKCTKNGKSVLYRACQTGNVDIVAMLLDNKAEVNKCARSGKSPLYVASEKGHTEVVGLLLDKGGDICICSRFGNKSPFFVACLHGYTEIVKMMLKTRFAISVFNARTRFNESPILVSCGIGHYEIVNTLLDFKPSLIHECKSNGNSLLHIACCSWDKELVCILLKRGADVNMCTRNVSPLQVASALCQSDIVQILLEHKADIYKFTINGKSVLYRACQTGNVDMVAMLLDNKAEVNKCARSGKSPLYVASEKGHTEVVRLLLDKGGDICICSRFGNKSPFFVACLHGSTEIVKMMLKTRFAISVFNARTRFNESPILVSCGIGHYEIVNTLLDFKPSLIHECKSNGNSLLHIACYSWDKELVCLLLKRGADVNMCTRNVSPLQVASALCQSDIVQILLEHKAENQK